MNIKQIQYKSYKIVSILMRRKIIIIRENDRDRQRERETERARRRDKELERKKMFCMNLTGIDF